MLWEKLWFTTTVSLAVLHLLKVLARCVCCWKRSLLPLLLQSLCPLPQSGQNLGGPPLRWNFPLTLVSSRYCWAGSAAAEMSGLLHSVRRAWPERLQHYSSALTWTAGPCTNQTGSVLLSHYTNPAGNIAELTGFEIVLWGSKSPVLLNQWMTDISWKFKLTPAGFEVMARFDTPTDQCLPLPN